MIFRVQSYIFFHFLKSFTIQCVDNTILRHAQILFLTNLGLK